MNMDDEWVTCPRCRYPMVPLRSFEPSALGEIPAFDIDITDLLWQGRSLRWQAWENAFACIRLQWRKYKVHKLPKQ